MLKNWLDVCVTDGGLLCCKMRLHRLTPLVQQMVDDWLDYYRRLGQMRQAATTALARSKVNDGGGLLKKSNQAQTSSVQAPIIMACASETNKNVYVETSNSGESEEEC